MSVKVEIERLCPGNKWLEINIIISSDSSDFTYTFNIGPCYLSDVRRELTSGEDKFLH